jgi:hypothetical protein
MKGTVKGLFESKKFLAALTAFVAVIVSHFSGLSDGTIITAISGFMAYIIGQGIADHGKEKEKVAAAAEKEKSYVLDNDIEEM